MKEFLRDLSILSGLNDQEIELLARTAEERRFQADERIVRKGEPGTSAFILKEGLAEALIEKPSGELLHLSRIAPGELFGELALFDDEPRSATVVATTECAVVEIRRDAFLQEIAGNPEAALKLLSLVAKRLRRAESVVSDFSDRIYGNVLPRLQEVVSAQLESAKAISQETQKRAESTIEQAKHLQNTADRHWTNLVRLGSIVGILVLVGGTLASIFGYNRIDDVVEQTMTNMSDELKQVFDSSLSEVEKLKSDTKTLKNDAETYVKNVKEKIGADLRDLEVMRQTALEFDKMRRDLQLGNGSDSPAPPEVSGDMARDFLVARRNLMKQYFEKPMIWESQILIEAMDLLAGIIDRQYIIMEGDNGSNSNDVNDWDYVIDTIEQALKDPPDHWRQRLKLSELVVKLYRNMLNPPSPYQKGARTLTRRLEALLESEYQTPEAAQQTALILAQLGSEEKTVMEILTTLQNHNSPWRRGQAAALLIVLGDDQGWDTLRKDLAGQFEQASSDESANARRLRERAAFAAAHQLAKKAADEDMRAQHYFRIAELDRQLSASRLSGYVNPWPEVAREGADLVGQTVFEGLTRDPSRWNRFYWQYACDLLCDIGCKSPGAEDGGDWCRQCLDQLETRYFRSAAGLDRHGELCRI